MNDRTNDQDAGRPLAAPFLTGLRRVARFVEQGFTETAPAEASEVDELRLSEQLATDAAYLAAATPLLIDEIQRLEGRIEQIADALLGIAATIKVDTAMPIERAVVYDGLVNTQANRLANLFYNPRTPDLARRAPASAQRGVTGGENLGSLPTPPRDWTTPRAWTPPPPPRKRLHDYFALDGDPTGSVMLPTPDADRLLAALDTGMRSAFGRAATAAERARILRWAVEARVSEASAQLAINGRALLAVDPDTFEVLLQGVKPQQAQPSDTADTEE